MAFPPTGGRKPFWPGKFGTSKAGKGGIPSPKTDLGMPEEFGMKRPMAPKPPRFMADGGMADDASAPPDPGMGTDPGMGDDAPPSDLDPVTLHYCIGLLQHLLDASAPPDDGMGQDPGGDDTGGTPPAGGDQFGGQ